MGALVGGIVVWGGGVHGGWGLSSRSKISLQTRIMYIR